MTLCGVCDVEEKKYCCPRCSILYCSLPCFKQHKAGTDCNTEEEEVELEFKVDVEAEPVGYQFTTVDTVPKEKLQQLEKSEKLRQLLSNPHLRTFLTKLDSSEDKGRLMRKAMREPLFVEFVDCCLETIGEGRGKQMTDEEVLEAVQQQIDEES